jgi:transposase
MILCMGEEDLSIFQGAHASQMFKNYRPYIQNAEEFRGWLAEGHLAFFVSRVVDSLDLSAFYRKYEREVPSGNPPFHPRMMVKLWVYAYCDGERSSRRIERYTYENAPYRFIAGGQHPDYSCLAKFRKRHLEDLAGLFGQVLTLAREANLVTLEHVSLDGSKVLANASKHKAMTYDRMVKTFLKLPETLDRLKAELDALGPADEDDASRAAQREKLNRLLLRREGHKKKLLKWFSTSKNRRDWGLPD